MSTVQFIYILDKPNTVTMFKKAIPYALFMFFLIIDLSAANAQGRIKGSPGQPFEVQITPYKTTMKADGKDTALIAVDIIDNQGKTVESAYNLVTFTAMGKGKLIAIKKGDNTVMTAPDNGVWKTNMYKGRCNVIVQTTTERGALKFEAKSDSLWTGSTDIQAVWPGTPHPVTNAIYKPHK